MDFKIPLFINTNLPLNSNSPNVTPQMKRSYRSISRKNNKSPIVHRVSVDEKEEEKTKCKKKSNNITKV